MLGLKVSPREIAPSIPVQVNVNLADRARELGVRSVPAVARSLEGEQLLTFPANIVT